MASGGFSESPGQEIPDPGGGGGAPRPTAAGSRPARAGPGGEKAKRELDNATKAELRDIAAREGGALSRQNRTPETCETLNTAADFVFDKAADKKTKKRRRETSEEEIEKPCSYDRVFESEKKRDDFQSDVDGLEGRHGPLLEAAGQRFRTGQCSAAAAALVGKSALDGLISTFKAAAADVEGANLEITYLERGNMDHVTRAITTALTCGEIAMPVAQCPQRTETLLHPFTGVGKSGKECPTCTNLGVGLAAGSSDDQEEAERVAKERDFKALNVANLPVVDADVSPLCPKLDRKKGKRRKTDGGGKKDGCGNTDCDEWCSTTRDPSLAGPGNRCLRFYVWVLKKLGLKVTLLLLGNYAGRWAFGESIFAEFVQSCYGECDVGLLSPEVRPLADVVIFEPHPITWQEKTDDETFLHDFGVAMARPLSVIFRTTVEVMERRLEVNLPAVQPYLRAGHGGGARSIALSLGLDPTNEEHRHVAAVASGVASYRQVIIECGLDPDNAEDRLEVGAMVARRLKKGRLIKQGVDPDNEVEAIKAMVGWAVDMTRARMRGQGFDPDDPEQYDAALVFQAEIARDGRAAKNGVDRNDKVSMAAEMSTWNNPMNEGRMIKRGVDPNDEAAVRRENAREGVRLYARSLAADARRNGTLVFSTSQYGFMVTQEPKEGSLSRVTRAIDPPWVAHHAGRKAEVLPALSSQPARSAANAEFFRRYKALFYLHQQLNFHDMDVEALSRAIEAAADSAERARCEAERAYLVEGREKRVRRWFEAYVLLNSELEQWKAVLTGAVPAPGAAAPAARAPAARTPAARPPAARAPRARTPRAPAPAAPALVAPAAAPAATAPAAAPRTATPRAAAPLLSGYRTAAAPAAAPVAVARAAPPRDAASRAAAPRAPGARISVASAMGLAAVAPSAAAPAAPAPAAMSARATALAAVPRHSATPRSPAALAPEAEDPTVIKLQRLQRRCGAGRGCVWRRSAGGASSSGSSKRSSFESK